MQKHWKERVDCIRSKCPEDAKRRAKMIESLKPKPAAKPQTQSHHAGDR